MDQCDFGGVPAERERKIRPDEARFPPPAPAAPAIPATPAPAPPRFTLLMRSIIRILGPMIKR